MLFGCWCSCTVHARFARRFREDYEAPRADLACVYSAPQPAHTRCRLPISFSCMPRYTERVPPRVLARALARVAPAYSATAS